MLIITLIFEQYKKAIPRPLNKGFLACGTEWLKLYIKIWRGHTPRFRMELVGMMIVGCWFY